MTRTLRLWLAALLLVGTLPGASPLAPEPTPVRAATDGGYADSGCTVEIVVLPSGDQQATRVNCEGNDDLTPVPNEEPKVEIYPPYCATGTRAFVTPRSYDKLGRVIAKNASGVAAAGGTGWEPTSVASSIVRSRVMQAVADQVAMSYTKATQGAPVLPNSFFWRALAPDLVAAYLQIEALPASFPNKEENALFGRGALVRRDLSTRIAQLITYDTSASKSSPYFTDAGYLAADEYGSTSSGFALAPGAANLTTALTTLGSPVWTLPIGKGASNLQLLPTTHLTHANATTLPTSWSTYTVGKISQFWKGFGLANRDINVKGLLAYNWGDASGWGATPFSTTTQVKTAVSKSFIYEAQVGGGVEGSGVRLPIKMMYRVERYVPVNRIVAWREYKQVWVPPTTKLETTCTNVGGKIICTTKEVPVPGYYKWVPTSPARYAGNPNAAWIAADYPQPSGSATTEWRPISKLVGYEIAMGPDTWATSAASMTSGIKGTANGLSGLLATPRFDANIPGGKTKLRTLEGDWWPVGVIPAIKNVGDTTVAQVRTLLDQAVLRQLGRDTNGDKRVTGTEGMTYGQKARWYTASGATLTPGTPSTLMLPAFRAPSKILTGAIQTGGSAGDLAKKICGDPVKLLPFGTLLGNLLVQPLSFTAVSGPLGGIGAVPMQRMGMVLFENNCRTNNIERATQYDTQLRGYPQAVADDTVGGACWISWGMYRIPLPFVSVSSDIDAVFEYYRVKRTADCPAATPNCDRWTNPILDATAVVGKPYPIVGATGTPTAPNPPASYFNVISTKSGFAGEPAYISASQVGITLEIGQTCRVAPGNDLVRYCSELTDASGKPLPGRMVARINRAENGYPASIVFERTPLSRLGDPDCRSLSRADLLAKCGIGYDAKSGNYFFRVRVRTWWDGVISHGLPEWPRPLGLFSNLLFSKTDTVNDESFDYLRSWGSPANLGLSDRATTSLTFAAPNDAPPVAKTWYNGSGAVVSAPAAPPGGWGSYWLCSRYATAEQQAACPVSPSSPEYRRRARPLFDAAMACNPDGSLATLLNEVKAQGAVVQTLRRADCYLDIPVVSSQPGAN